MIWQCLDQFGSASDPFITKGTINGEIYLEGCLKKRLLPLILKHHRVEDVILWMDMATAYYKKEIQKWLRAEGIDFVEKSENAPNVPQA